MEAGKRQNRERLHCGISLKLFFEDKAFGPGIASLLRRVEEKGSLLKAAQSMGMAYSKAWSILRETERVWGFKLTNRETGGRDGGGSTLTPKGKRLLQAYEAFADQAKTQVSQVFDACFTPELMQELMEDDLRREEEQ